MHEVGLAHDVLHAVERHAAGRRIVGACVRVGAGHRVSVDALTQGFSLVAEGSVVEGADLEVQLVPARLECRACQATTSTHDAITACPSCGSLDVDVEQQDELTLVWIKVADA